MTTCLHENEAVALSDGLSEALGSTDSCFIAEDIIVDRFGDVVDVMLREMSFTLSLEDARVMRDGLLMNAGEDEVEPIQPG